MEDMIKYDLKSIVNKIETSTNQTAYLSTKLDEEYIIGNVDTTDLEELGFTILYTSNDCGVKTPIYRYGNIEAIYVGQLLHVYKIA